MSSVTPTIFAPVPDIVVILRVGISVYALPPSDICIFCMEHSLGRFHLISNVSNSKTIWSVVLYVSGCSKSNPSSVIML